MTYFLVSIDPFDEYPFDFLSRILEWVAIFLFHRSIAWCSWMTFQEVYIVKGIFIEFIEMPEPFQHYQVRIHNYLFIGIWQ